MCSNHRNACDIDLSSCPTDARKKKTALAPHSSNHTEVMQSGARIADMSENDFMENGEPVFPLVRNMFRNGPMA